jgi:hypothetical protein
MGLRSAGVGAGAETMERQMSLPYENTTSDNKMLPALKGGE